MLEGLLTEQRNPASRNIDALPTEEILRIINEQDRQVADAVMKVVPDITIAVDAIVEALNRGDRLFYIGAGTSGRLGVLDAAECPPTFNVDPEMVQAIMAGGDAAIARSTEASEDSPEEGAAELMRHGFTNRDVLVGIAASGRTPFVLGAVEKAKEIGAVTVGISCTPESDLSKAVHIAIEPTPGPEVIAGSTRMRAGTATKLVLNMISTAAMIRLGHVYGNLMVNVQPKNEKLVDRARRIIAEAAEVGYSEASVLLEQSGRNVKAAIVMARRKVSRQEAERLLETAHGRISSALKT
jgi:N-acetylmuramic acid 6-phosphate etherase